MKETAAGREHYRWTAECLVCDEEKPTPILAKDGTPFFTKESAAITAAETHAVESGHVVRSKVPVTFERKVQTAILPKAN